MHVTISSCLTGMTLVSVDMYLHPCWHLDGTDSLSDALSALPGGLTMTEETSSGALSVELLSVLLRGCRVAVVSPVASITMAHSSEWQWVGSVRYTA